MYVIHAWYKQNNFYCSMDTDKESTNTDADVSTGAKLDDLKQEINSRVGFTSEEFKIELNGLPKFFSVGDAKKLLARNNLSYHKVKPCGRGATYMFVNFKNEEDREKAIAVLDGQNGKQVKIYCADHVFGNVGFTKAKENYIFQLREAES